MLDVLDGSVKFVKLTPIPEPAGWKVGSVGYKVAPQKQAEKEDAENAPPAAKKQKAESERSLFTSFARGAACALRIMYRSHRVHAPSGCTAESHVGFVRCHPSRK